MLVRVAAGAVSRGLWGVESGAAGRHSLGSDPVSATHELYDSWSLSASPSISSLLKWI